MKKTFYILTLLRLLTVGEIYSQTKTDLKVIGQWKLTEVKMISGGKVEKRKEKETLFLNVDGTYKRTNKRGESAGSWTKSDSTLKFVSKDMFTFQNIITKITKTDLTLFTQDGPADFYSTYKRQK